MLKNGQTYFNPLSAKFIKWPNTLKQFVGKLPTNCLSVFDHIVGLALKRLKTCRVNTARFFKSDSHLSKSLVLFASMKAHKKCSGITNWETITKHILSNISRSKGNQIMDFGLLIDYNMRNIFIQNTCSK